MCDQFGHISFKCENPARSKRYERVNLMTVDEDAVAVKINQADILATLDTDSFKMLLQNDEYLRIGSPTLSPIVCMFKGFGNARIRAIDVFDVELTIRVYHNEIHVVPPHWT